LTFNTFSVLHGNPVRTSRSTLYPTFLEISTFSVKL